MAKRFTDTEIWDKPWFMELSPADKCAIMFIKDKCNCIGIWIYNDKIANCYINDTPDWKTLPERCNGNIIILEDGKWWLPDFCDFQYGKLNENCPPHKKYILELKKYGLYERVTKGYSKASERVPEGYPKGIVTLQEKEKEKEKDKELEKDKEKEEEKEKEKDNAKTNKKIKKQRTRQEKDLYNSVKRSFESVYGPFPDYRKEGTHIWLLIEKAIKKDPDTPEDYLKAWLGKFRELKLRGSPFWQKQPFLPSVLNSGGIWPRFLEEYRETRISDDWEELLRKGDKQV